MLLDTCVLSELRKPEGEEAVKAAVGAMPSHAVFISVLSVGEITEGIIRLPLSRKRQDLEAWCQSLVTTFADRVLPVDLEIGEIWGEVTGRAKLQGITIPIVDGLLAATALHHGLYIMTRNVRHMAATGALLRDPWKL